ncbi:MAG: HAD family phosphatase [Dehalococcoidia bacterium]|nr:HAD family phosphatase [Dehalococcoidia bacterium]
MISLPRPAAVAFDLDGTLVDTEAILIEAQRQTLMDFGITGLEPDHPRTFGMGMEPGVARLSEFYRLDYPQTLEVFRLHWARLSATELTSMPGARALLMRLRDEGVRMALVTSADPVHAQNALKALSVPGAFECVVDAEMVSRLKPSPEPYLKAAECLGVSPQNMLAIEDSGSGVESALAAGMRCVAVHAEVHERTELAQAQVRIRSLIDFPQFT